MLIKVVLRNLYSVVRQGKLYTLRVLDFVKICQICILFWENTLEIFVLIFPALIWFLGSVPDPGLGIQQIVDPSDLREWLARHGNWAESAVL